MCRYRMPVKSKRKRCHDITLTRIGSKTISKLAPCGLFHGLKAYRGKHTRKHYFTN
jgi:hypothetical protein